MKKSEILELLDDKIYESEIVLEDSYNGGDQKYAVVYGILFGTITYILEKCDDIDD